VPHVNRSALPAARSRLVNPVASLARTFLGVALLLLGAPALLFLFPVPPEGTVVAFVMAGALALSMGITSAALAWYARRVRRRLRRFQKGDYLVYWTFTQEEWEDFARDEFARCVRVASGPPLLGLFLGSLPGAVLGGCAGAIFCGDVVSAVLFGLLGAVALGSVGAGIDALIRAVIRGSAGRCRQRVLSSPREAYIGTDAAYCAGRYWSWKAFATWLGGIRLVEGALGAMEFRVCTQVRGSVVEHRFRVPLPETRLAEALWLIRILRGTNH
jgi:hypothetical protein